jgi:hypothetical protein
MPAARREAASALELQPDWSYARVTLLQEIDTRSRAEEQSHD